MAKEFENMDENLDEDQDELLDDGETQLIELVDEDGETQEFELLGSFDLNDSHYLALSEPIEDDESDVEVFILKIEEDDDGNDIYVSVDDDEANEAFEYFLTLVDAEEE